MPDDAPAAVLLDYYGTLAHATHWVSADDVLAEHGYELPLETRDRWFNDGIDGIEHLEHSLSRDHYTSWQRERLLGMLAETDVHPGEYEMILAAA
jgi:putative hydrolase of the HAD superfamily